MIVKDMDIKGDVLQASGRNMHVFDKKGVWKYNSHSHIHFTSLSLSLSSQCLPPLTNTKERGPKVQRYCKPCARY